MSFDNMVYVSEDMGLGELKEVDPTRKVRVHYNKALKMKIVSEIIFDGKRIVDQSKEYNASQARISAWKREFGPKLKKQYDKKNKEILLSNESSAVSSIKSDFQATLQKKDNEISSLYSLIGKLTVKISQLEKKG